jgi:hypothetical protein
MGAATKAALKARRDLRTKTVDEPGCEVVRIQISGHVEVGTRDGWLRFWTAGREVRIGPLSPQQAEDLAEDLGYDAVG